MALVFHRTLAIPFWTIVFVTVALTAPPPARLLSMPPTLFVTAIVGLTLLVFTMLVAFPWVRPSRSLARVNPSTYKDKATAGSAMTAGISVRTPAEPDWRTAEDALDLVRMDDDGGWQPGVERMKVRRLLSPSLKERERR